MIITESYRKLNEQMHKDRPDFGARGGIWAQQVADYAKKIGATTATDFGAGKGGLKATLRRISPLQVTNYDPAVPEFSAIPEPADLVVSTDVLEHVEPACLIAVITEIQRLAIKGVFLNIACREAKKTLADGRNAHLLVRPPYFWFDTLREFFDIEAYHADQGQVTIIGRRVGALWT